MNFDKLKASLRSYFEGGCGGFEVGPYEKTPPPGAWPDQRDCVLFRERVRESIRQTRGIIQCKNKDGKPLEGGYAALVEARARSNQRLVTVFGIDNAFTTYDAQRKIDFVVEVNDRVKNVSDEEWQGLANMASYWALAKMYAKEESPKRLDLTDFVQFLTMKVSLHFLFGPDSAALRTEEGENYISFIAKEINRLWLVSKADPILEKWEDQTYFHQALHYVTGSSDTRLSEDPHFTDSKENPLNWILPAYESMWRIVLTTVRQLYLNTDDRQHHLYAMLHFLKEPCKRTFRNQEKVCRVSAHHLIKECLRLYPPVRRIGRTLPENGGVKHVKADIRECQRNYLLADFEPDEFHPERWEHIEAQCQRSTNAKSLAESEEQLGFLPFGLSPFKCPAGKSSFAFRMIGVLAGATLNALEDDGGRDWSESPDEVFDELGSGREEKNVLLWEFSYN
ncbi:hypothetical protein FKW77_004080 [Venturia effusa]|uniref:Uncharacterized protein n=1 Tax=Venturia effusa TaxID=50376 RepID=A0A517L5A8_9PEZI|nr:hypothetical protein FKW77_004080 [Venturia effusa]